MGFERKLVAKFLIEVNMYKNIKKETNEKKNSNR